MPTCECREERAPWREKPGAALQRRQKEREGEGPQRGKIAQGEKKCAANNDDDCNGQLIASTSQSFPALEHVRRVESLIYHPYTSHIRRGRERELQVDWHQPRPAGAGNSPSAPTVARSLPQPAAAAPSPAVPPTAPPTAPPTLYAPLPTATSARLPAKNAV